MKKYFINFVVAHSIQSIQRTPRLRAKTVSDQTKICMRCDKLLHSFAFMTCWLSKMMHCPEIKFNGAKRIYYKFAFFLFQDAKKQWCEETDLT